jgi:hypothetical protein
MGNKASLSYCSVCYDGRYYSEDIMSDDIDAIIYKDERAAEAKLRLIMEQQPEHHNNQQEHQDESSAKNSLTVDVFAHGNLVPRSHRRQVTEQMLNQLSFSSQLSMEGRELCIYDKRAASTCEREDVEDDVMMQRSDSILLDETEDHEEDDDRISASRLVSD